MELPADIDGELLRLRTGQEHAEVERPKEQAVRYPAFVLHQRAVHDGDLPGRPAEVDEAELQPEPQRLAEWDRHAPGSDAWAGFADHCRRCANGRAGGNQCGCHPRVILLARAQCSWTGSEPALIIRRRLCSEAEGHLTLA